MTAPKVAAYIVVLKRDLDAEDAEDILTALSMVTGVLTVEPLQPTPEMQIVDARVRYEIAHQAFDLADKVAGGFFTPPPRTEEKS